MWLYLIPTIAAIAVGCFAGGALFIGDLDNDTATMRSVRDVAGWALICGALTFVVVFAVCWLLSLAV